MAPAAAGAAQGDDDALVVFESDNPKVAPIIQRANTQAAKYRDARNQTRAELATARAEAAALAARVKELEGTAGQIVAFKSKMVDNYLGDALRAAGATQVQVTRLLPSLRGDVKDVVKVGDDFSVSGDVSKQIADLAKDFGFAPPKPADTAPATTTPTSPGAGNKTTTPSAPGAGGNVNTNPLLATLGNRGRNPPLVTPTTDPHANQMALVQRAAQALEAGGWGKQDQLPPPPASPAALESEPKK